MDPTERGAVDLRSPRRTAAGDDGGGGIPAPATGTRCSARGRRASLHCHEEPDGAGIQSGRCVEAAAAIRTAAARSSSAAPACASSTAAPGRPCPEAAHGFDADADGTVECRLYGAVGDACDDLLDSRGSVF